MDDARITATIKAGVPGTEMPAFGGALTELQVFQLIQHIRTATATARPAPAFVANPNGTVVQFREAGVSHRARDGWVDDAVGRSRSCPMAGCSSPSATGGCA